MMLQAVAHDVKNKLAELAMRLMESDIEAAALALDAADQLSHALLLDNPDQIATQIDAACPADLVEELAAVYGQLFARKTINIDIESAPALWYYDVTLMRLAFSNAVHNALQHCARVVTLRASEINGFLVFEVRNDGELFCTELLERNWDDDLPDSTIARKSTSHSTGIGLLLAHKILQAHVLEKDNAKRYGFMRLANEDGAVVRLAVP